MDESNLSPKQKQQLEQKKEEAATSVEGAKAWLQELNLLISDREAVRAERKQRAAVRAEERAELSLQATAAKSQRAEGSTPRRPIQRLSLTEVEFGDLRAAAKLEEMSVTAYVTGLFSESPSYSAVKAEDEAAGFYNLSSGNVGGGVGRKPIGERATIEHSPNTSMSGEALLRARAEAAVFGLSLSDLIRKRILKEDPRQRGRHLGKRTQETAIESFIEKECDLKNGATAEEVREHYEVLIHDEMERMRDEK